MDANAKDWYEAGAIVEAQREASLAAPTGSTSGLTLACVRCGNMLSKQGGLLFSPPDGEQRVRKIHLCRECWELIDLWLRM